MTNTPNDMHDHGPNPRDGDGQLPPKKPLPFSICDARSANWLVRRVKGARAYAEHVQQWAAEELGRAKREEQILLERYGPQLEKWVKTVLANDRCRRRRRSIRLPAGQVGLRVRPMQTLITQERLLVTWCKQNLPGAYRLRLAARGGAAIRIAAWMAKSVPEFPLSESADGHDLIAHIRRTGHVPPGTRLKPAEDSLYIQ